jgi:hypothetical protein
MTAKIECSQCGWRHTVPCGRDDCPHDAATHYHYIATALDNAVANGCLEQLARMSDEDIAYDLARLDAYCERIDIPNLVAGVRAWREPQSGRDQADLANLPHWKRAEQLIADCEIGPHCNICRTLRGLLDERLSVRQQAVRETIESLGQKGWLEPEDTDALLATLVGGQIDVRRL